MSQGKYSPNLPTSHRGYDFFDRNAKGEIPQIPDSLAEYDEEYHFASYDPEGFDVYGYSAYDRSGEFVGGGRGVDRNGYTEMDYLNMSVEEYEEFF